MIKDVKPVKVSPTIKTARWGLLLLGIVYGNIRYQGLKVYEEKARVIRHKKQEEKHAKEAEMNKRVSIEEIKALAKEFDVKPSDLPPGWEDDL